MSSTVIFTSTLVFNFTHLEQRQIRFCMCFTMRGTKFRTMVDLAPGFKSNINTSTGGLKHFGVGFMHYTNTFFIIKLPILT